jgi:antitoxin CptB
MLLASADELIDERMDFQGRRSWGRPQASSAISSLLGPGRGGFQISKRQSALDEAGVRALVELCSDQPQSRDRNAARLWIRTSSIDNFEHDCPQSSSPVQSPQEEERHSCIGSQQGHREQFMKHTAPQAKGHEHPDIRCRRLLFRCWHRGTQESDLILGSFAEGSLETLDSDQIGRFEALLDCTDPDLFDWIFGVSDPPPEHDHDVMQLLRRFCTERPRTPRQIGERRI